MTKPAAPGRSGAEPEVKRPGSEGKAAEASAVRPRRFGRAAAPYLLLLPSTVFMLTLFGWPVISAIQQAFTGAHGSATENWRQMVDEPQFWESVRNTLLLVVVLIPLQFALALTMALLLRERLRASGFYFYVWSIPLAVSDLAAGLVWLSIFTDNGYLNSLLGWFGLGPVSWLSYQNKTLMFLTVLVAELWRATSLVLVILVSGMQTIPRDYDEAAQVFGASSWQRLRHVTLPLMRPSIQVALILRTILAFQAFAVAQALTGNQFPLLVGQTYLWFVGLNDPHVASAVALVVLGVSMVTAVGYLIMLRRNPEATGGAR